MVSIKMEMKNISMYLTERLKVNSTKKNYNYYPTNTEDLRMIVDDLLEERGWDADLNDIDISKIDDISNLFAGSLFNGDISEWDVSNVNNMNQTFYKCTRFNCDISQWDVSNVKSMYKMFYECKSFNQDLSKWDVANVTNMDGMLYGCKKFKYDLSNWNINDKLHVRFHIFSGTSLKNLPKWYIRAIS